MADAGSGGPRVVLLIEVKNGVTDQTSDPLKYLVVHDPGRGFREAVSTIVSASLSTSSSPDQNMVHTGMKTRSVRCVWWTRRDAGKGE